MSAYNGLPEITLSKKCAKYLLTRNAGEKALFRKESFLIEKAKTKQEKAFRRERELLIHRECRNRELIQATQLYGRTSVTLKKISRSNEGESDWEIKSDTSYARQRRRPGVLFNKKYQWLHCGTLLFPTPRIRAMSKGLRCLAPRDVSDHWAVYFLRFSQFHKLYEESERF